MLETHSGKDRAETSSQELMYRVAVFSRVGDFDLFTETLISELGLNRIDARIHAAHVPGVLPEELTKQRAEHVAVAVRKLGMSAAAVSQADIPNLDHPIVVHHAACSADGLESFGLSGARSSLIRWPDVEFVSVGNVPLETAHHSSTDPLVVVHSSPHTFDDVSEHVVLNGPECWIIARHPQRIYFLNHNRMNYDYLGHRKSGSATANFGEFLKDVAHLAEDAFLTPATHKYLDHGPVDGYTFSTAEQLKQTSLVQFLLHKTIESEHLPKHD